jgi:hypothetical protein
MSVMLVLEVALKVASKYALAISMPLPKSFTLKVPAEEVEVFQDEPA